MTKNDIFDPKTGHFGPTKTTQMSKITFSVNLHYLHFQVKFKQKMAEKWKTIAQNGVLAQKGPWTEPQKTTKSEKVDFLQKTWFYTFQSNLSKKEQKNPRKQPKIAFKGSQKSKIANLGVKKNWVPKKLFCYLEITDI